jgi:hypothetical protein
VAIGPTDVCCAGTPAPPSGPQAVLLTGGWNEARLSSAELYGSSACTIPSLPVPRSAHVTFMTGSGQLATCGGTIDGATYRSDCLVLTPGSGWEPGVLGSLTRGGGGIRPRSPPSKPEHL